MKMNLIDAVLDLHFATKDPVCFVGPAGVGKTQAVKAWAKHKRVKCFEYRLAYSEPGDLRGLPVALENGVMRFTRPEDLPSLEDENCVILLDEINRGTTPMQNAVMQMTDGSGRIGSHILPKGTLVVATMNPDNDNSYMVNSLDKALVSRFSMVPVDYDRSVLLQYARDNKWDSRVIGFISMEVNLLSGNDEFDGQTNVATPRNLERLSNAEKAGLSKSPDIHKITSAGLLGPKVGQEYFAYATGAQPVSLDELLHNTEAAIKRTRKFSEPKAMRGDLLGVTNSAIGEHFKSMGDKMDKKTQKVIVKYLETIPADLAVGVLKTIFMFNPNLVDAFQAEESLMERLGERLKAA